MSAVFILPRVRFAALAATLACIAPAAVAQHDALRAGFDRMLAHEPGAVATPVRKADAADPLLAALVVPLRDGVHPPRVADPVAESFARMLAHEPSRHLPARPDDAGDDPLIAAVAQPLLRSGHLGVARVRVADAR